VSPGAGTGRSPRRYLTILFISFFFAWTFPGAKENAIAQKSAAQRNSNRNLPLKVTVIPAAGKPTWLTFPRRRPRHVHQDSRFRILYLGCTEKSEGRSKTYQPRGGSFKRAAPKTRRGWCRSSSVKKKSATKQNIIGSDFVYLLLIRGTHLRAGERPQGLFRFGT
jgi:hypothetical protein